MALYTLPKPPSPTSASVWKPPVATVISHGEISLVVPRLDILLWNAQLRGAHVEVLCKTEGNVPRPQLPSIQLIRIPSDDEQL